MVLFWHFVYGLFRIISKCVGLLGHGGLPIGPVIFPGAMVRTIAMAGEESHAGMVQRQSGPTSQFNACPSNDDQKLTNDC